MIAIYRLEVSLNDELLDIKATKILAEDSKTIKGLKEFTKAYKWKGGMLRESGLLKVTGELATLRAGLRMQFKLHCLETQKEEAMTLIRLRLSVIKEELKQTLERIDEWKSDNVANKFPSKVVDYNFNQPNL